ncbi:MAG: LPD29 domain-containing protein [Elusimicrobiota bacterium]
MGKTNQKKERTNQAKAASEIRKVLKREFPQTKFSVTSKGFSMGDSVSVRWIDGPTREQVENKISQFQEGHFDGRQDLYIYSNTREDMPQTKYLSCDREMSEETKEIIKKRLGITDEEAWNDKANCWNSTLIYREFVELDLSEQEDIDAECEEIEVRSFVEQEAENDN